MPKVLAARKESVLAFAGQWQRYVGGGELVYTRTQQGRRLLLAAKAQRRPKVKQMACKFWR